jgi:hypothetical protein
LRLTAVAPLAIAAGGAIVGGVLTSDSVSELIVVGVLSVPFAAIVCAGLIPLIVVAGVTDMVAPELAFFRLEKLRKEVETIEQL